MHTGLRMNINLLRGFTTVQRTLCEKSRSAFFFLEKGAFTIKQSYFIFLKQDKIIINVT